MMRRISFILNYWAAWVAMFLFGRLFFLFVTRKEGEQAGFNEYWGSLLHGLRMDASMATYLLLPVIILVLLSLAFPRLKFAPIVKVYTNIILFIALLIFVADAQSFKFWGYRMDASILNYLSDPKEAAASTAHFPLLKWTILFVAAFWILARSCNAMVNGYLPFPESKRKWPVVVAILALLAVSIIPLRGGLQLAPINQSSVYFSQNNYANQAALNPVWNFSFSIMRSREITQNPFLELDPGEAAAIASRLLNKTETVPSDTVAKKNVILIVWESFTAKVVDLTYEGTAVTPNFNRLKKEGIWFSNAYATGDRTDKGIVGVLSGYPSQPIASIVKNPEKARKLPQLASTLRRAGYHTSFYYGGEMEFANIKSYLLSGNFNHLVDVNTFESKDRNSKWGVHDGVVKDTLQKALGIMPQPFFTTWLTLSSHEPYETPVPKVIPGDATVPAFLNSLHYTDNIVGSFVSFCRSQPWWNNTLLVIVADHGHRYPLAPDEFKNFHIPVLILGGGVQGAQREDIISQTGLPSTLLKWNGLSDSSFAFSQNWMQPRMEPWAFFSFNNGFGYLKKDSGVVYDNIGKTARQGVLPYNPSLLREGKALQQTYFQDFLEK